MPVARAGRGLPSATGTSCSKAACRSTSSRSATPRSPASGTRRAQLTAHTDQIDLEDSHTRDDPRIRRIKLPHKQSPVFDDLMRSDAILAPVRDLIGPNLRLQNSKLNMKSARYGAPVDWHQDWAFYPYTNDDILAVGVFLDDVGEENGPLMVFPGTHRGPAYDHHSGGYFAGTMSLAAAGLDPKDAVRAMAPKGSISIHHVRIVHGSDLNRSDRDRAVLFYEVAAADAFPIAGSMGMFPSLAEFDARMLCGSTTIEPRVTNVPVRIPQPQPPTHRLDLRDPEAERGPGIRARADEGDVAPFRQGKGPARGAPGLPKAEARRAYLYSAALSLVTSTVPVSITASMVSPLLDLERVLDAEAAHVHRVLGDRGGHLAGEDRLPRRWGWRRSRPP